MIRLKSFPLDRSKTLQATMKMVGMCHETPHPLHASRGWTERHRKDPALVMPKRGTSRQDSRYCMLLISSSRGLQKGQSFPLNLKFCPLRWWRDWNAWAHPQSTEAQNASHLGDEAGPSGRPAFNTAYLQAPGPNGPGPISNAELQKLVDENNVYACKEGENCAVITQEAWRKLKMWYGGGPVIECVWVRSEPQQGRDDPDTLVLSKRIITVKLRSPTASWMRVDMSDVDVDVLVRSSSSSASSVS